MENVSGLLESNLKNVHYTPVPIHLINGLKQIKRWSNLPEAPLDVRYKEHMNAGDDFRKTMENNDALALLGVSTIIKERFKLVQKDNTPSPRTAYILRSLKTPEEIETLRKIYGNSFIVIAAFSNKESRTQKLAERIAVSNRSSKPEDYLHIAEDLIRRDEADIERINGQNLRDAFHRSDCFLNTGGSNLDHAARRTIELIFGNTFHTPTIDEHGMFHAWGASLRSASLARQVGAAIATEDGQIVAVGCNEVPKACGGYYWPGDNGDTRDHILKSDSNDDIKFAVFADVIKRLKDAKWLSPEKQNQDVTTLLDQALQDKTTNGLGRADLLNITEYGRSVHAEMSALMDAAQRGVSVNKSTLYTTTFPCHNCTKHIIAAGITRVVYIEPYPKSYAYHLHKDSIQVDAQQRNGKRVQFEAFAGVSPRIYFNLFSMGEVARKLQGKVNPWASCDASPRLKESPLAYLYRENEHMIAFKQQLKVRSLEAVTESKKL
jgi:cytidine deaminase